MRHLAVFIVLISPSVLHQYRDSGRDGNRVQYDTARVASNDETLNTLYTPYGVIQGSRRSVSGIPIREYFGIPYAKPPVKKLRFQRPRPLPWRKSRYIDATRMGPSCPQTSYFFDETRNNRNMRFSEDCLYLNVWTAGLAPLRPVLVFIHGGFFTHGGSESPTLDMSHLAARGVIAVSFNYRLNAMGFLYAGVPQASGNMGLYDQQLAMQWIRKHIRYFGGDPTQMTVMGHGAGATAAAYHLLNPTSRKIFKRMILLSGNPFSIMNLNMPNVASTRASTIAKRLGCSRDGNMKSGGSFEIFHCMASKDANEIAKAAELEFTRGELSLMPLFTSEGFLKKSPEQLVYESPKMDDVEILMGHANNAYADSLYYAGYFDAADQILPGDIKYLIGMFYGMFFRANALPILRYYFRDNVSNESMLLRVGGRALADGLLVCPGLEYADEVTRLGAKVYYYSFDHTSAFSKTKFGVTSSEEVLYFLGSILGPVGTQLGASKTDRQFARDMLDLVATFVYYGRAYSPKMETQWLPYAERTPYVVSLDGNIAVNYGTRAEECNFWSYFWNDHENSTLRNYTHVVLG